MSKTNTLGCIAILISIIGGGAVAQEQIAPPFTGAARTGSTYVLGVKVDVNWAHGRTADVFVSIDGDIVTAGSAILTAVQRVTGCVGQSVQKTAQGISEFQAVVKANCRTRWGDGVPRSVQVATFSRRQTADELFISLNLAGLLSSIQPVRSGGRTLYRVMTPAYQSPSEVLEVLAYIKALGYRDAVVR